HSLRRRRSNALYPCLGIAATTLVGLHALLDFSLEIPAIAVTYAAILGACSGRLRPPIPGERDQAFQLNATTDSGRTRPPMR
ncbi:MAG TPA: hypothetical protein VFS48_01115, partial [Solirubrobacterales bacterium]|nr:hypothetical protein [Solirubrobacterales bacterium]